MLNNVGVFPGVTQWLYIKEVFAKNIVSTVQIISNKSWNVQIIFLIKLP
jgi:hypothetical protein